MAKVHVSARLNGPASEVWGLIGRWNALPDWHPAVLKSELSEDGKVRRLTLSGGGLLEERLETSDESRRTYTYALKAGPLPVASYRATIAVTDRGAGAAMVERLRGQGHQRGRGVRDHPRDLPRRAGEPETHLRLRLTRPKQPASR